MYEKERSRIKQGKGVKKKWNLRLWHWKIDDFVKLQRNKFGNARKEADIGIGGVPSDWHFSLLFISLKKRYKYIPLQ
jgi:hypothetical protein